MHAEERWLPLFPLKMVLFPNASLPLQIFEERYKLLTRDCLEGDSKFGVVLIKAGAETGEPAIPHSMGTVAHIVQVNNVEGGRIFMSVTGQERFQIKSITQYRPYMAAQVELVKENPEERVPAEVMEAIGCAVVQHTRLVVGLRGGWVSEVRTPSDPVSLSYFVAEVLPVGLREKQALLEEVSTSQAAGDRAATAGATGGGAQAATRS